MRSFIRYIKTLLTIILTLLLGFFAIENAAVIEVSVLDRTFETRRFILIAASVAVGFLLGLMTRFLR